MTSTHVPRRVSEFRLEELDGNLLLYHPGLTKTVHLNETASLIWQLCDGKRSSQEIADLLLETFPEEAAQVVKDVEAALARLADEGAVEFA